MGVGTQPPISHEHITRCEGGVHLLYLGETVSEEGCDHQLQEQARAGVEQPQQSRHGKAAPRPLCRRLAERLMEGRGIRREQPEPSTKKVRCPCHSPSFDTWGCMDAQRRVNRRPKRSRGSFVRA